MAGSPNCPIKVEERRKQQQMSKNMTTTTSAISTKSSSQGKQSRIPNVWFNNVNEEVIQIPTYTSNQSRETSAHHDLLADMNLKLNQLITSMEKLSQEQAILNSNITNAFVQIKSCQNDIDTIKVFTLKMICPFLINVGDAISGCGKKEQKEKFHPKLKKFKQHYEEMIKSTAEKTKDSKSTDKNQHVDSIMCRSSSNESISSNL